MKRLCSIFEVWHPDAAFSSLGSSLPVRSLAKAGTPRTKRRQANALQIQLSSLCVPLWLTIFLFSSPAHAQGPLLIQEVISREVGLFNGQGPDNQVISREVSMYVEWGRDNQVISREYSLVMTDSAPPPIVSNTLIVATASPSGHTVTLDWSAYNQWAIRDVSYYAIYYSLTPFTSVTGLTPYIIISGETLTATFTGLTEWVDHYFAVVPVDGLGHFEPSVLYKGAYVLFPQMISREVGLFIGQGPDNQIVSREYSLNYVDTNTPPRINNTDITMTVSPKGDTVMVDWSPYNQWAVRDVDHYAIYYSSTPIYSVTGSPFRVVPGETLSTTFTGLTEWVDHYFAVVPVDGLGNYDSNVLYRAAYVLFPQMISREVGLFIGQGPDQEVISREVSFIRADTNVPAAVSYLNSPFDALASRTKYGAIDLNWSFYDEWAQRDVVRYRLYISTQFFNDVSAMTVTAYSANGTLSDTVTNLACEQIYYSAVVAEDVMGNLTTAVYSISSKASVCSFGDVSNLVGQAAVTTINYTWDLGGIGTDLGFFVKHFKLYLNESTNAIIVPSTNRSYLLTGLTPQSMHVMKVATVDIYDTESTGMLVTNVLNASIAHIFFWTNHAGNVWSASGVWTNNMADGTTPNEAGSNRYMLAFQNTSPIVANNNLGRPAFEINRLLLWNNSVTVRGSQLVFRTATATSFRPLIFLLGTSHHRVEADVEFPVLTTYDGSGSGGLTMAGAISGEGTLIKSNAYTLVYEGTTTNIHTGRLIHQNGLMIFAKSNGAVAAGSGSILQLGQGTAHEPTLRMSNSHQFGQGVVMVMSNAFGNWTRFDLQNTTQTLAGIAGVPGTAGIIQNERFGGGDTLGPALLVISNTHNYFYEGYIRDRDAGAGVYPLWIRKSGGGTQMLAGANITYTGGTEIEGGRLVLSNATAFRGGTGLVVQTGSELELNAPGTMRFQHSIISGGGTVVKRGVGSLLFGNSGAPMRIEMAADGVMDVQQGVLRNDASAGVWSNNLGSMHIANGATTMLWDADIYVDKLTGLGVVDKGQNSSHYIVVGVNDGSSTFDGQLRGMSPSFTRIWKKGAGTVTLTSSNSAQGLMVIEGGTLEVAGAGVLGSGTYLSQITNHAHVLFSGSATQQLNGPMHGTGVLTRAGTGLLRLAWTNHGFLGHVAVSSGVFQIHGRMTNATFRVWPGGTLGGTGWVGHTVVSEGIVDPGTGSAARLYVSGNYTQLAAGTLVIGLRGQTPGVLYDQLSVSGTATLEGSLSVAFENGYHPATNQSFMLLSAAMCTGEFSSVGLPLLTNGLVWKLDYSPTGVTLTASSFTYPPGIVITNPPADITVSNDTDVYTVQGTASGNLWGDLAWSNALTGESGTLPPTSQWSLVEVPLAVGSNRIEVKAGAAAFVAMDEASNAVYSAWDNGDNGGYGWGGGWSLVTSPFGGHFRGTTVSNPNMSTGPFGWGMWANGGGFSAAVRDLAVPLTTSQVFSLVFDNNSVQVGGTVGIALQNNAGTNIFELFLIGGQSTYFVNDSLGSRSSGISASQSGWQLMFQLTGGSGYHFQMGASVVTGSLMAASDQNISRFRAFNFNSGAGQSADFFINNLVLFDYAASYSNDTVTIVRLPEVSDADNDGLPDWWETLYGLNPSVSNMPDSNADGDWMTDWEEYVADTHPTNGAAFFPNIILTNPLPGAIALVVNPTSTARVYQVRWSTNLLASPQFWTLLPPEQTGTGAALIFNVTNDAPGRSYRTGVRLP